MLLTWLDFLESCVPQAGIPGPRNLLKFISRDWQCTWNIYSRLGICLKHQGWKMITLLRMNEMRESINEERVVQSCLCFEDSLLNGINWSKTKNKSLGLVMSPGEGQGTFGIQLGSAANNFVFFKHFGSSGCWRRILLGDVPSARNEQQALGTAAKICQFLIEETQHVLLQVMWKNRGAQVPFSIRTMSFFLGENFDNFFSFPSLFFFPLFTIKVSLVEF